MSNYPNGIDNNTSLPPATGPDAVSVNANISATIAVETALGILPAGVYASVRTRLDILEARINNPYSPAPNVSNPFYIGGSPVSGVSIQAGFGNPDTTAIPAITGSLFLREDGYFGSTVYYNVSGEWYVLGANIPVGGDLSGTSSDAVVVGLQTYPISSVAPTDGFVLTWSGTAWTPTAISSGSVTLIGDVIGPATSNTVSKIQGVSVATTSPVQSAVPIYDTSASQYDIRPLTQDDILAGFTINSFTGGSTVEVGATVVNPTFTASYSHEPNSASITNTDGTDSPLTLSAPYTSGTVVGSFSHNAVATVAFTLTAIYTSTKTAVSNILFLARSFSGLGTASATGASASGNNAALVGATGTLTGSSPDGGLFSSIVGQSFGPFNPTAQKIYLLTPHTSSPHSFKDQNGFIFAFNSPSTFTFTNQNGANISYDLYESTVLLSTTFTITVES